MTCTHVVGNIAAPNKRRAGLHTAVCFVRGLELNCFVGNILGKLRSQEHANCLEGNWLAAAAWWKEGFVRNRRLEKVLEAIAAVFMIAWGAADIHRALLVAARFAVG